MKILALDGGGVFGIGQAQIVAQADTSKFDLIVGTSIGSMIGAYLAQGSDPSKLPDFFHIKMPLIFSGYWWRHYKPITPKYSDKELDRALQELLSGTFGSLKRPMLVTAVDLESQSLKVFNSKDPSDASIQTWEVIRSGVAAETYFAPWKGMGDGGIFANNPTMVAIAGASSFFKVPITEMEVCSIGTGESDSPDDNPPKKGSSIIKWGLWIMKTLLNGSANSMHEYFARSLPLKKYERIQFVRDQTWNFDNPQDMLKAEVAWKDQIVDAVKIVKSF